MSAEELIRFLQRVRVDLSNEKALQAGIAQALSEGGFVFEREKRLSDADIPDFFFPGGIALECKMKGKHRKIDVYRQLLRYAEHEVVTAVVLASNTNMGLPAELAGKPVYVASLSRGWVL